MESQKEISIDFGNPESVCQGFQALAEEIRNLQAAVCVLSTPVVAAITVLGSYDMVEPIRDHLRKSVRVQREAGCGGVALDHIESLLSYPVPNSKPSLQIVSSKEGCEKVPTDSA